MIASIVGLILVTIDGIGGWWTGYYYYFSIDTSVAAPWGQFVHVPIVLGFLLMHM